MKKAVISVLVGTAVLAFVACGKNAATENSSDSGVSTVSASSQVENGQKATRVNQGTNLSPGSPKNIPSELCLRMMRLRMIENVGVC